MSEKMIDLRPVYHKKGRTTMAHLQSGGYLPTPEIQIEPFLQTKTVL
jgi:hypothetical protein